jgi:antigen flippase
MSRVLFSIGVVQVLVILVNLARSKILSLLLGPAGFGIVSTIDQVVLTTVNLAAMSFTFTALKFMARSHSQGEEPFRHTFAAFLRILGSLAGSAVAVVSGLLVIQPGVFGADLVPYRGLMHIAVLSVPAVMLNILFVNTLAAAQRPMASAVLTLWVTLALAVATVVGAVGRGIGGLYVATVVAGVLTTGGTLVYLRRTLRLGMTVQPVSLMHELRRSPEIVRFSLYLYTVMAAYSLTMLGTRYFVFSRLGEAEAGLFQAVMSVALTVGAALGPMSNVYLAPLVNRRMPVEEKLVIANDFARKMIVILLLVSLPVILFPRLILTVLFSQAFAPAAGALFVFVLWQCLYHVVNVYQQLLIGLDDVVWCAFTALVAFGTAAAVFPTLIPRLGLSGAPAALGIGYALGGLVVAARLRVRFDAAIAPAVWRHLAVCLGVISIAGMLLDPTTEWTPYGVAMRALCGLAAVPLLWSFLSEGDRAQLRARMRPGV